MVEIFITNIKSECHSREVQKFLEKIYPNMKINFDLEDFNQPYPCGHSVLRVESEFVDCTTILNQLKSKGIKCQILEDNVCN